ncbi:MAG: FtsX-like permease family protein, partial [Candidatus Thorarchaeota archaeon]
DQLYELGLLRAIGNTKHSIFFIMFCQILVISIIGMLFGLLFGGFIASLFFGPLKSILMNLTSLYTDFNVIQYISPFTLLISIIAGLLIPLTFGIIPSISAARTNVLASLKPYAGKRPENLKSTHAFISNLIIAIFLIITGTILVNIGFSSLLSFTSNPTTETSISIVFIFLSQLLFLIGFIMLGTLFLPKLILLISHLLFIFLRNMKKICYRNLTRNLRRTKNAYIMISLGLAFLITMLITLSSVKAGVLPGARLRLGGDIRLGRYYTWDQTIIPLNTSINLSQIDNVAEVCEVKNSYWGVNRTLCETFGTHEGEAMILFVINTSSYVNMHSTRSIYNYEGKLPFADFIHQLDITGSIFLQKELSEEVNKNLGQKVTIKTQNQYGIFPEISANLTIAGIINMLPGIEQTYYDTDGDYKEYAAIISWDTYYYLSNSSFKETTGYFWLKCDNINNVDDSFEDIRNLYNNLGFPWNILDFDNNWIFRTVSNEINLIEGIINLVLFIFLSILTIGLIISILGMMISMIMNINYRRSEFGIYRAIGISKLQITQMISGETLIIGIIAIITGIIGGIITGYLVSLAPFIVYVPILFKVNWLDIILISMFILNLNIITSFIPAIKAVKLKINDLIRKRGE